MKIVDSKNNVVFESSIEETNYVYNFLIGNASITTEEDYIKYSDVINKSYSGSLKMQLDLSFRSIDYWNRPTFIVNESGIIVGSVDKLFHENTDIEIIKNYFRENPDELVIFGSKDYDDEDPLGSKIGKRFEINIL